MIILLFFYIFSCSCLNIFLSAQGSLARETGDREAGAGRKGATGGAAPIEERSGRPEKG